MLLKINKSHLRAITVILTKEFVLNYYLTNMGLSDDILCRLFGDAILNSCLWVLGNEYIDPGTPLHQIWSIKYDKALHEERTLRKLHQVIWLIITLVLHQMKKDRNHNSLMQFQSIFFCRWLVISGNNGSRQGRIWLLSCGGLSSSKSGSGNCIATPLTFQKDCSL